MLRGHRNRPLASNRTQEAGEMSVDHWLSAALLRVFITFPKIQRPVNWGGSNYWHLQAGPHPDEVAAVIWSLFLKQYWGPLLPEPDPHGALVLSLGWNHWEVLLEKRGRQEWHGRPINGPVQTQRNRDAQLTPPIQKQVTLLRATDSPTLNMDQKLNVQGNYKNWVRSHM